MRTCAPVALDVLTESTFHPSEEQLRVYCRDRADARMVSKIETHLSGCGKCSQFVVNEVRTLVRQREVTLTPPPMR